jgi:hypothetical protein
MGHLEQDGHRPVPMWLLTCGFAVFACLDEPWVS